MEKKGLHPIRYYSTNNKKDKVDFETALMRGLAPDYGLYMIDRKDIPQLSRDAILNMRGKPYARIAFEVLFPFLWGKLTEAELQKLLDAAYDEDAIRTHMQHVVGRTHIMWLTRGPTYSFKDYAARFFGRILNHFLRKTGERRLVVVATSGDTGGAVADALHGLDQVENLVFFPKDRVTDQQRRQMTTLGDNVHAFEVDGDFDVCQSLAKGLLGDKPFAEDLFGDRDRLTSANSISIGRLLPQAVYPFYAYSRIAEGVGEPMIPSIPSGNFGDMLGTVLSREMGLPIKRIVCGVNENREFPEFLRTEKYRIRPSITSPSSAMIVSNPSNFARLVDLYGGHVFDRRNGEGKVLQEGVMDKAPDIEKMRENFYSLSVTNQDHYAAIHEVYQRFGIILDPHGSVGWKSLDAFLGGNHDRLSVIYETADPGKFPDDVHRAIGIVPEVPAGIVRQAELQERIYSIDEPALRMEDGTMVLSDAQFEQAKDVIRRIYA